MEGSTPVHGTQGGQPAVTKVRIPFIGDLRTRSIIAGVLLGVMMPVLIQVAERLDTLLFGGVVQPFGVIVGNTIGFIGSAGYGFIVGLIGVEINPFIAVATGSSPFAPFFFATNFATVLGVRLMMMWRGKRLQDLTYLDALYMALFAELLNMLAFLPVQLYYINMSWSAIIPLNAVTFITGGVVPAFIALPILKALLRANLVGDHAA